MPRTKAALLTKERKNISVGNGETKVSVKAGDKHKDHWIPPCLRGFGSGKKFKNIILGQWLPKSPCNLFVVTIVITFIFKLIAF